MSRARARITHDEVARMVKAAQHCGLSVGEIVFNGSEVRLVIGGDIGERASCATFYRKNHRSRPAQQRALFRLR